MVNPEKVNSEKKSVAELVSEASSKFAELSRKINGFDYFDYTDTKIVECLNQFSYHIASIAKSLASFQSDCKNVDDVRLVQRAMNHHYKCTSLLDIVDDNSKEEISTEFRDVLYPVVKDIVALSDIFEEIAVSVIENNASQQKTKQAELLHRLNPE